MVVMLISCVSCRRPNQGSWTQQAGCACRNNTQQKAFWHGERKCCPAHQQKLPYTGSAAVLANLCIENKQWQHSNVVATEAGCLVRTWCGQCNAD